MKNGMRVIDCENHVDLEIMLKEMKNCIPEEMKEQMKDKLIEHPEILTNILKHPDLINSFKNVMSVVCDVEEIRLKEMDIAGIDFAQLSLTTPGAEFFPIEIGKKIATIYNDLMIATIAKHPDRFGAYMALVPEDVEWSLKEIDRCVEGGLFGWSTLSNYNGKYLDDPKYFPIIEKIAKLDMPIYLHPNFCPRKEYQEFGYCLNGPSLGFTADTQLLYMRLIHRGIFDKCPNLKVIMGHDCEGMGFFKNRMDTAWRQGMGQPGFNIGVKLEHEPSYYLDKNTWGTTSGNYSQIALSATIEAMGVEKVMLGTDFYYEDIKGMVDFIGDNKQLTREQKEAILYKNAEAIGFGKQKY